MLLSTRLLSLLLLLPHLQLTATRAVVYPVPYYGAVKVVTIARALQSQEKFLNSSSLPSFSNWQFPQITLPMSPTLPSFPALPYFMVINRVIHSIIATLQHPASLFNALVGNLSPKGPSVSYPHNIFLTPLGNISFSFGFSFNFDASGSFGFAKMQMYNVINNY